MGGIAFLAHRLPYPPDRGDRIRSWHVLKALAKREPVHVFALIDQEADRAHVETVEKIAASVTVIHRRKSKTAAIVEALRTGKSASVLAFVDKELHAAVATALPSLERVYAFSSQMAAYVPENFEGRFVMDFVDMDSAKFEAMGWAGRQEARRLHAWEIAAGQRADLSLFVSEPEAELFTRKTGLPAQVMGNGIDFAHFAPDAVTPAVSPGPLIVFTGQMDYGPNVDAVTSFTRTTLPRILTAVPDAIFAIVGHAPTRAVRSLAGPHVIVSGDVPDTRPWLAAASVVVAPLRIARGVQNKVLEAMAMEKACVVSSGAAMGIEAIDGRALIVSDNAAAAVVQLLQNRELAASIGKNARATVINSYSWDTRLARLPEFLGL